MAELFIHLPRQVQVPSFKTRNSLLKPAFISFQPSASPCSEVSFDSLPRWPALGLPWRAWGCRGSGGLLDKDALSHPTLQTLLLPTNQLTKKEKKEEERGETERGLKKKPLGMEGKL